MINDLFHQIPEPVQRSLYADDGAEWICTDTLNQAFPLIQRSLSSICEWSDLWGLDFSPTKSSSIIFTLKRCSLPTPLMLNGTPLPVATTVKFLGITFDKGLTWKQHILQLRSRCQSDLRLLSLISRNIWGCDLTTLRALYISLILSKLDYGCFLFSEASDSNLVTLDRIQYSACRIILGAYRPTPTAQT